VTTVFDPEAEIFSAFFPWRIPSCKRSGRVFATRLPIEDVRRLFAMAGRRFVDDGLPMMATSASEAGASRVSLRPN
jgi:hypothetical protein